MERIITKARANTLAARRVVHKTVRDQAALAKLFATIGPRFKERPGGYTRLIHTKNRVGDNAPMSILELVEKSEKTAPEKKPSSAKKAEAKKAEAKEPEGAEEKKPAKEKKAKKKQEGENAE